ncbi:MAG: tryptophan-rich sensory protein [Spirochaetaceae bacterium]|jgi:hypothetical protein|nr:tryptophan-rich sensory protein [Spirochaetaceae bacterium]
MKISRNHTGLAILNAISFVAVLVFNSLASIIPLGGLNTGQISDLYPNLFVPAGLTFSIWGLIYLLLAVYVIYNFISKESYIEKIGLLFFFSSLANICWIISWQYRHVLLSLFCILIILVTLIRIYQSLNIGHSHTSKKERYMVHLPFSVYFGWITVATIANVTAVLVDINWNRFGLSESFWTVAVIIVAITLGLIILFLRSDIAYALVVDWALLGILIKRLSLRQSISAQDVITTVIVGLVLLSSGILIQAVRMLFFKSRVVL